MQSLPHIVRENLFALGAESDDACLVGLSGGADSTALILSTGGPGSAWKGPVVAAHLDHGVRECSASDRMWVENLCRELAVPLITHRIGDGELPALRKKTRSLEAAMRRIRYAFLLDAARSSGAKWVLTGHTSDDQVETVLFRVLRRMDPRSLAGIPPRREIILRPMLGVTRQRTLDFCREMGVEPLQDPSNRDLSLARNRLRHAIIPALEAGFHGDLKSLVLNLSDSARRLVDIEESLAGRLGMDDPGVHGEMRLEGLMDLPDPVKRSVVRKFLVRETGRQPSAAILESATGLVLRGVNGRISLPGQRILESRLGKVSIKGPQAVQSCRETGFPLKLPVPGKVVLKPGGPALSAKERRWSLSEGYPAGDTVLLRKRGLKEPLWVRTRRPGDRFRPLGMKNSKKLKDFLIDRKVPRSRRDTLLLVVDDAGEILWVAGVEISEAAALDGYDGEEAVAVRLEGTSTA